MSDKPNICNKCGHEFTVLPPQSDPPMTATEIRRRMADFNAGRPQQPHPMPPASKHTPGPWHDFAVGIWAGGRNREPLVAVIRSSGGTDPRTGSPPESEAEANARLIAAAPELLEALKRVKDTLQPVKHLPVCGLEQAYDLARSAIAQATE